MKKINIYIIYTVLLSMVFSCKDEIQEYDINWPVPEVSSISPAQQTIGEELTITGAYLDNKVTSVRVGGAVVRQEDFVSQSGSQIVVIVPRAANAGQVEVLNIYEKRGIAGETFTPKYPRTLITEWPSSISLGTPIRLTGENVDLITKVQIGSKAIDVDGSGGSAESISIPTGTANLVAGDIVTITVLAAKGGLMGETSISGVPVLVPALFPEYKDPIVLFDFEGGPVDYHGAENGATASKNGGGVPKARGENYFTVKSGAVGSWKNLGYIEIAEGVDLGEFTHPHLTFLVNTHGKEGYFQLEDGQGNWYHFKRDPDDYKFVTNGWEWRSYDLNQVDDGRDLDLSNFRARLYFKTGNVGGEFEINIDQVMVTNGKVKPVLKLWDFESTNPFIVDGEASTNGLNLGTGVEPFMGTGYLTVKKAGVGSWTNLGKLEHNETLNLSDLADPHLTFWINTKGDGGYFQLEDGQGSWGHFTKDPDDYKFVTNGWERRSVRLKEFPWEGAGFDVSAFKPLLFVKTGNVSGNFELNLDEVYISDGPMY